MHDCLRFRGALAGFVTIASLLGSGAGVGAQTLEDALVQAYQNNPTLLAERARLRSTDEGVAEALSDWRPTVTVSGDIAKERQETTGSTSNGVINREPSTIAFEVTQSLYRGGRTVAATEEAEHLVRADRARLAGAEQTVLLAAATAYVDTVRDAAVLELTRNNESVLTRQLEATRDRFRVGEVTRTDVAQAESRLARAKADLFHAPHYVLPALTPCRSIVTIPWAVAVGVMVVGVSARSTRCRCEPSS